MSDFNQQIWQFRNKRHEHITQTANRVKKMIQERKHLTEQLRKQVLYSDVSNLVQMLNASKISSVDLLLLFSQIAYTHGLNNCYITDEMFEEGLKTAQECDARRDKSKLKNWTMDTPREQQCLPALFGIPISVKDTIQVKGKACTVGLLWRTKEIEKSDGLLMSVLRQAGVVPFVKTNTSQLGMTYEIANRPFGRACNPWDELRTTGGSSGGEGGLIACHGSPMGVGADIGGSIRIPAQFCGLCGLKPSSHRLSIKGHVPFQPSLNGIQAIPLVMGPLAHSPNDLALFMKVMTDPKYYDNNPLSDPYTVIKPFDVNQYRQVSACKGLRIGYFQTLSTLESTKATKRAVNEAAQALRKLGHELIPIEIPNQKQTIEIFMHVIGAEGRMKGYYEFLKGQPIIEEYHMTSRISRIPSLLMSCLTWIAKKIKPRVGWMLGFSKKKSAYEYLTVCSDQQFLKADWIDYWRKMQLDVVLAPGFGSQAQLHHTSKFSMLTAAYTFIWNVLEMTCGTVSITVVREDEQKYQSQYSDMMTTTLKRNCQASRGLPVGVQIVGLPYEEEKVLGVMKALDDSIQFSRSHRIPV